nr:ferrochelatase-2, chloroplastic [Tanacetum cinerariifolium]
MADLIQKELQSFVSPKEVMIFFSAHRVSKIYVRDVGDLYRDQMEECIHLVMQEQSKRSKLLAEIVSTLAAPRPEAFCESPIEIVIFHLLSLRTTEYRDRVESMTRIIPRRLKTSCLGYCPGFQDIRGFRGGHGINGFSSKLASDNSSERMESSISKGIDSIIVSAISALSSSGGHRNELS